MTRRNFSRATVLRFALPMMVGLALSGCRPAQGPPPESPAAADPAGDAVGQAPSTGAAPTTEASSAEASSAEASTAESPAASSSVTEATAPVIPAPAVAAMGLEETVAAAARVPAPAACPTGRSAVAATLDAYKHSFACRIHERNGAKLYEGAPPPLLRSVVVLSVRIDAAGRPVKIGVLRSNGVRELERRAIQSVRDAAPLPAPGDRVLRQGMANITETWLFRDDGRFQIRTLASAQAGPSD